jgi:hypothetical protein
MAQVADRWKLRRENGPNADLRRHFGLRHAREDGKIVERWDAPQPIPDKLPNSSGMFYPVATPDRLETCEWSTRWDRSRGSRPNTHRPRSLHYFAHDCCNDTV